MLRSVFSEKARRNLIGAALRRVALFAAKIPQAVQATVKFLALLARAEWFKAKARPSVQAML